MSSITLPLLAAAALANPSAAPVTETVREVMATAVASASIVSTVRPDWSGTTVETMLEPSRQPQQDRRIARRAGPQGEAWYDLEFQ